jgi:hypothetical protein
MVSFGLLSVTGLEALATALAVLDALSGLEFGDETGPVGAVLLVDGVYVSSGAGELYEGGATFGVNSF